MKRVLSLGAGVQSSTMALMVSKGLMGAMPAVAVFADTRVEPESVYRWLEWLKPRLAFPVLVRSKGDLGVASVEPRVSGRSGNRYVRNLIPVWWRNKTTGKRGAGSRKCTRDYKIDVIRRTIKVEVCGLSPNARLPNHTIASSMIGISTDEAQRMKPSELSWIQNEWPLIEAGMSRTDCLRWMRDEKYPEPPRSACYFCPYHSGEEWRRLKTEEPDEFEKAVRYERRLQHLMETHDEVARGVPYLWHGLVPLDEATFNEDGGKVRHMGNECEGICGV